MKIFSRFTPLLVMGMLAITIALSGCGKDALQKAVKDAFIKGDTTETTYQAICDIITGNPEKYSAYVDADGNINTDALDEMINEVGQSLRPPMTWNTKNYGQRALSLSIYFERSGSMVPYDQASGAGQLKKAVNDLINFFPGGENASINIVNDNIYPYSGLDIHTMDLFFLCRVTGGSIRAMDDAARAIWLPWERLCPEDFGLASIRKGISRLIGEKFTP